MLQWRRARVFAPLATRPAKCGHVYVQVGTDHIGDFRALRLKSIWRGMAEPPAMIIFWLGCAFASAST